jgi:hypothetical protein
MAMGNNLPKEITDKIYNHPELGSVVDCFLKSDIDIFGIETSVTSPVPVDNLGKGYTITKDGIIFND